MVLAALSGNGGIRLFPLLAPVFDDLVIVIRICDDTALRHIGIPGAVVILVA